MKKFTQKISLFVFVLALALLSILTPVSAIQLLYPGVKINNKALTEESFLLSAQEMADFAKLREDLKAAQALLAQKEKLLSAYENSVAIISKQLDDSLRIASSTANRLKQAADEKDLLIKANHKLHRRSRLRDLIDLFILGFAIGQRDEKFNIKF